MINRESSETFIQKKQNLNEELLIRNSQEIQPKHEEMPIVKEAPKAQRLASLDILRGLTIIGMLMVDNQTEHGPSWIRHIHWNGMTMADLVFPSFVFIMGMAVPMSLSKTNSFKPKNFVRIIALFGIGLFLNAFSKKFNFHQIRIMGILQRLSLCYAVLVTIHVITDYGNKAYRFIGALIALGCLMVYTAFMMTFTKPEIGCHFENNLSQFCNFGSFWDRKMFGIPHMYEINDPEGLFTTLAAVGNAYAGYLVCLIMKDNKGETKKILILWTVLAFLCGLIAWPLTELMPLNKKIWSISYVFLTCGISTASLSFITLTCDVLPQKNQTYNKIFLVFSRPLIWMGRNPLAVFIGNQLIGDIFGNYIFINGKSLWDQMTHYLFESWITNLALASMAQAFFYLFILMTEAYILFRKNIFVKL